MQLDVPKCHHPIQKRKCCKGFLLSAVTNLFLCFHVSLYIVLFSESFTSFVYYILFDAQLPQGHFAFYAQISRNDV